MQNCWFCNAASSCILNYIDVLHPAVGNVNVDIFVTKILMPIWMWSEFLSLLTDCRWEITAYFRILPEGSTSKNAETWVPSDAKQWQQPPVITPIKSMSSEPLGLQVYAEDPMPKN